METNGFKKRKRFWYCKVCGYVKVRFKHDDKEEHRHCGEMMQKSRVLKYAGKIREKRWSSQSKIKEKVEKFRESYHTKLRNNGGEVLRFSKETKQHWKKVRKTKTIPAFQKYGEILIKSILTDVFNIRSSKSWNKKINFTTGEIEKSRGGLSSSPQLVIVENTTYRHQKDNKLYGTFGSYNRAIRERKYQIEISKDVKDLNAMKKTFLHELIHWIDDLTDMDYSHDEYFFIRLKLLEDKFKI